MGEFFGFSASGTIVYKIIMIFNNNHFDFLPNLLQLCALYCETVVYILIARNCFFFIAGKVQNGQRHTIQKTDEGSVHRRY